MPRELKRWQVEAFKHRLVTTAERLIELVEGISRDPRLVRVAAQTLGAPERFIPTDLLRVEEHALRIAREGRGQLVDPCGQITISVIACA